MSESAKITKRKYFLLAKCAHWTASKMNSSTNFSLINCDLQTKHLYVWAPKPMLVLSVVHGHIWIWMMFQKYDTRNTPAAIRIKMNIDVNFIKTGNGATEENLKRKLQRHFQMNFPLQWREKSSYERNFSDNHLKLIKKAAEKTNWRNKAFFSIRLNTGLGRRH